MGKITRLFEAYLDTFEQITVIVPKSYRATEAKSFTLKHHQHTYQLPVVDATDMIYAMKYQCTLNHPVEVGYRYDVVDEDGGVTDLQIGAVIRTREFDTLYRYDGDDLGTTYTKEKTTWKLWAPTAQAVRLRIYGEYLREYPMNRNTSGVWSYTLHEDCEKYVYTYLLCINLDWRETSDSYSIAVTADSSRSVVIDMAKTNRVPPAKTPFVNKTDAIIYEAHIRDLTIASQLETKGKYTSLIETAVNEENIGIAYLKDLGITHLELLPFNDFGGVEDFEGMYNWGYNPIHFNVPEGWYATDVEDPYQRINELKALITTLHKQDIRIIMDVVYNHIYIYEDCTFGKTVPGYYFRYNQNGLPSNGTGVGNDIASERYMARKFIIDSVLFWAKEYGIDGFRFDLMGILDVDTMNHIRQEVNKINPEILLLGEGWDLSTPLAHEDRASIHNAGKMPDIAFFNDFYRDAIKGGIFAVAGRGYALGNTYLRNSAQLVTQGTWLKNSQEQLVAVEPSQSINYVECHDNHTMWDKIMISNQEESDAVKRKRHTLATAFILLSQGIPFIHGGQEFYRTKLGIENSYNSPDAINQMDWERRDLYEEVVDFLKDLISLRKSHGAFRFATKKEVETHMEILSEQEEIVAYRLYNVGTYGDWGELLVYFHIGLASYHLALKDKWTAIVYGGEVDLKGLYEVEEYVQVPPLNVMVLGKKGWDNTGKSRQ